MRFRGLRDVRGCCAEAIWRGGRAEEIGSRGRRAAAEDLAEKTALGVVAAMANKNREKLGLETTDWWAFDEIFLSMSVDYKSTRGANWAWSLYTDEWLDTIIKLCRSTIQLYIQIDIPTDS